MIELLSQVETTKPLPAFRKNSTMGTSFLSSDWYRLEADAQWVRISHPDNVHAVARVPWAGIAFAFEVEPERLAEPATPAALGERIDPTVTPPPPVVRVAHVQREEGIPAALRPPEDGSTRMQTVITAEQAAGMSESALEAAINDGAIVQAAPKAKGWPKGKKRGAKAPKDSAETP